MDKKNHGRKEKRVIIDDTEYLIQEPPFYEELKALRGCTTTEWNEAGDPIKTVDETMLQVKQVHIYIKEPEMTLEDVKNMSPAVATVVYNIIQSFFPNVKEKK